MISSQKISALAVKAIEGRGFWSHDAITAGDAKEEMDAFQKAATPEAWLALRNEADEANLKIAQQFNELTALRARCAEMEGRDALRDRTAIEMEAAMLALRNEVLEEAAKLHEPSCSCPHPCDDYWHWPSPCHKKAAAVIRALKHQRPA